MLFCLKNFKRCSFRFASLKVYIKSNDENKALAQIFVMDLSYTNTGRPHVLSTILYYPKSYSHFLNWHFFFFSTNVIVGHLLHIFVLLTRNKSLHIVASISLLLHMTKPPHVNLFYLLINRIYLYFFKFFISSPFFCIITSLP